MRYKPAQLLAYLIASLGYENRLVISKQKLDDFLVKNQRLILNINSKENKVIATLK